MSRRSQHYSHRGMRTVAWAVAGVLFLHLVGGLLLDYRWPEVRFPSAESTLQALRRQPRDPDILCLGSSRFGAGFVQEQIRQQLQEETGHLDVLVFNAAIEAGDLITAEYVLGRMVEQGICPSVLVVEISPETLARRCEWMGQHALRQLTWEDLPQYWDAIWRSGNTLRMVSARLLPLHMHRRQICLRVYNETNAWVQPLWKEGDREKNRVGKRKPAKTEQKLPDQGVPWEVFKELAPDRHDPGRIEAGLPAIRRWLRNYEPGGCSGRSLERMLALASQRGMTVILVGVPVAEAHRRLYTPEIEEAFQSYLRSLCERHDCLFVDYRHRIPDALFQDNHHLTRAGGTAFSHMLAEEVLLPIWRQRRAVTLGADTRIP